MRTLNVPPFVRYQLPVLLWAGAIFVASSIPSKDFPDVEIFRYDKLIHLAVYGVLGFLVHRALSRQTRFPMLARSAGLWTVLLCVFYGMTDEFHQSFVPGRDMSVFDLMADSFGALASIGVVWLTHRSVKQVLQRGPDGPD